MSSNIEVRVQGYSRVFRSGYELVDLKASLSMDDKASQAEIVLADPDGSIASDFVAHTIANGGILPLPEPVVQGANGGLMSGVNPQNEEQWVQAVVAQCAKSGVTDVNAIAYILGTARHETGGFRYLEEIWEPTARQLGYEGRRDLGNTQPGDGKKYLGRGLVQITGRTNYTYWSKRLGDNVIDYPERVKSPSYALVILVEGMRDGTFTGLTAEGTLIPGGGRKLADYFGDGRADFIGARAIVNGSDQASKIAGYAEAYVPKVQRILASGGQVTTTPTAPTAPGTTTNSSPEIKGTKLLVAIEDKELVYYHQATEHSGSAGTTTLKGVGIRYELTRRPRNRTTEGTSLKALATQVSTAAKIPLDWQVQGDVLYDKTAQKGQSDYAFLKAQCDASGLFITEDGGKIVIKSMDGLRDTRITYTKGQNIIDYSFNDRALDASKDDRSTALQPSEPKATIDPVAGTLQQDKPAEATGDTSTPGKAGDKGTKVAEASKAPANVESGAKKRLRGLPSSITVPLNLDLRPLDAVRTAGFPATFVRIWVVEKVSHEPFAGTTVLDLYSPVEAPVSMATASQGAPVPGAATNPGGFINPLPGGLLTSPYGPRGGRMHKGIDIATPNPTPQETGLPVLAAASGVVQYADMGYNDGYGGFIEIRHDNGWQTNYAHLSSINMGITVGARVTQGQQIAVEGNTGRSRGVHLHFEILDASGQHVDPQQHIKV